MSDAADTVVYAPDDGWKYHPKHVEQFPQFKSVTFDLVGYIYIYILDYTCGVTTPEHLFYIHYNI